MFVCRAGKADNPADQLAVSEFSLRLRCMFTFYKLAIFVEM